MKSLLKFQSLAGYPEAEQLTKQINDPKLPIQQDIAWFAYDLAGSILFLWTG